MARNTILSRRFMNGLLDSDGRSTAGSSFLTPGEGRSQAALLLNGGGRKYARHSRRELFGSALACGKKLAEGAAGEAKQIVEQDGRRCDERDDDDCCRERMSSRHPREPHGQDVFSKTQNPIAEWLRAGVHRGSRAGLRTMRGESNSSRKERRAPAPFGGSSAGCRVSQECGSGRANERVDGIPDGVEVRYLVREKFNQIKSDSNSKDPRVGKNLQGRRKLQHAVTLEKAKRGHSCVKIQSGGKSGAESEAERFDEIHPCPS